MKLHRCQRRRPRLAHLLAAALGLLLVGSALADANAPFAWEVQGPKSRQFLLGSVHLLPQMEDLIPPGIDDLYESAEGLMFETDIGAITAPQVQVGMMTSAHSLRGLKAELGAPMYARLQKYMASLGVKGDACAPFKPWFCALTLDVLNYQRAGFTGDNGLDEQLYASAQDDGKSVRWFEAPATHIGLFTDMSDTLSRHMLESTLDESAQGSLAEPKKMLKAWRKDDFAAIEKLVADLHRSYPDLYEHLLAGRNRAWMPKLTQALDGSQPQLIVVGAAHLAGPDGLLALLRARGYKITPYIALPGPLLETRLAPWLQTVRWTSRAHG
ncbi:MAG: TraB/GumN family protein [Nevskia sp.]|nr:TraB/GumN family protein [Nevskia sp.]